MTKVFITNKGPQVVGMGSEGHRSDRKKEIRNGK
jgi:hypothetical protein